MSSHHPDTSGKGTALLLDGEFVAIQRPDPCVLASRRNPEVALFLSLNCPHCGQLASLDGNRESQPCLIKTRPACQYQLSGEHHEFRQ